VTLSALGGKNLTVPGHLVRRRNLRLLEKDILVSDGQTVLSV
jgi:hypothetical protein